MFEFLTPLRSTSENRGMSAMVRDHSSSPCGGGVMARMRVYEVIQKHSSSPCGGGDVVACLS